VCFITAGPSNSLIVTLHYCISCRVGCGGGAGVGGGGARAGPAAGRVEQSSCPASALAPFPVPGCSFLWTVSCCWGGGWCCCGAATHAARSVAACNRGPPSLTSASTSGLSRPVLPGLLWRVVCWVGFLLDVICGVEIALWEGCYPALTLAHGVCVIVYV
jgi:hypothetical protein